MKNSNFAKLKTKRGIVYYCSILVLPFLIFYGVSVAAQDVTPVPETEPGSGTGAIKRTDIFTELIGRLADSGEVERALISKLKYWRVSEPIKVCFWGGEKRIRRDIASIAKQWEIPETKIKFDFGDLNNPRDCREGGFHQIRVGYAGRGYWSYVGQDSITKSRQDEISLNLQGFANGRVSRRELRRVALHEFGHALGFTHEHKRCTDEIDPERAYAYYKTYQGWDRKKTDKNVLEAIDYRNYIKSNFDPKSVMIYPLPRTILRNGRRSPCYVARSNSTLSTLDIETTKLVYAQNNEINEDIDFIGDAVTDLENTTIRLSEEEQKIIDERIKIISSDTSGQSKIIGEARPEFVDVDVFACNKNHSTASLLDFLIEAVSYQPKIGRLRLRNIIFPDNVDGLNGVGIIADKNHPEVRDAERLARNISEYMGEEVKILQNSGDVSRWYLSIVACR